MRAGLQLSSGPCGKRRPWHNQIVARFERPSGREHRETQLGIEDSGRRDRRSAFTFIELMVVILMVGIMAAVGAGVLTPQISYFRSRRDAENLLIAIRKARSLAMARGQSSGNYGVIIFRGSYDTSSQSETSYDSTNDYPYCFLEFADHNSTLSDDDLNLNELSKPLSLTLAGALTEADGSPQAGSSVGYVSIRDHIVNCHDETSIHGTGDTAVSDGTIIQFSQQGELETDSGKVSSLYAETTGSGTTWAYSFDVKNPNMGYYRIRIRTNGTSEISACCDLSVSTPYSYKSDGTTVTF